MRYANKKNEEIIDLLITNDICTGSRLDEEEEKLTSDRKLMKH